MKHLPRDLALPAMSARGAPEAARPLDATGYAGAPAYQTMSLGVVTSSSGQMGRWTFLYGIFA
jgi:hypothetical protein